MFPERFLTHDSALSRAATSASSDRAKLDSPESPLFELALYRTLLSLTQHLLYQEHLQFSSNGLLFQMPKLFCEFLKFAKILNWITQLFQAEGWPELHRVMLSSVPDSAESCWAMSRTALSRSILVYEQYCFNKMSNKYEYYYIFFLNKNVCAH